MDVVYLINSVIFTPLIVLLKLLTRGKCNFQKLSDGIEGSYERIFQMTRLEVVGFRRLRTMS